MTRQERAKQAAERLITPNITALIKSLNPMTTAEDERLEELNRQELEELRAN